MPLSFFFFFFFNDTINTLGVQLKFSEIFDNVYQNLASIKISQQQIKGIEKQQKLKSL